MRCRTCNHCKHFRVKVTYEICEARPSKPMKLDAEYRCAVKDSSISLSHAECCIDYDEEVKDGREVFKCNIGSSMIEAKYTGMWELERDLLEILYKWLPEFQRMGFMPNAHMFTEEHKKYMQVRSLDSPAFWACNRSKCIEFSYTDEDDKYILELPYKFFDAPEEWLEKSAVGFIGKRRNNWIDDTWVNNDNRK